MATCSEVEGQLERAVEAVVAAASTLSKGAITEPEPAMALIARHVWNFGVGYNSI